MNTLKQHVAFEVVMNVFKVGLTVFLTSIAVLYSEAHGASVYPIQDPLLATITSAVNHTEVPYKVIKLEPLPERRNVPLLENRNQVSVAYFAPSNKRAPLAFVIAGIGGSGLSGTSLLLAGDLNKQGYAVITLPDPVNWQYVLGVSRSGTPGYLPQDAREYYAFMKFALKKIGRSEGLQPSGYSVVGYSYGALLTGYLMKEDNTQNYFNFRRAVLINPAVDLNHGMRTLDGFYDAGKSLSKDQKDFIKGSILNAGANLISGPVSEEVLMKTLQTVPEFSKKHRDWIVGDSFRQDLRDVVFATQQIHDMRLLKQKATSFHQNARLDEALEISFRDYITEIILPSIEKKDGVTLAPEELMAAGSLYPLMEMFAGDSRIYMQENANDFLLHSGDLALLQETFKDRLLLYPFGGHIGGTWFSQNRRDLSRIMSFEVIR